MIQISLTFLLIKLVASATKEESEKNKRTENSILLSKVVQYIVDTKLLNSNRRGLNPISLAKARNYYAALTKNLDNGAAKNENEDMKKFLRHDVDATENKQAQGILIENELKNALTHKKSALLDRPFVEHHGQNDYLVMRPDILDPYVTIVPNHIYYNAEKKCVNWLDDCSLRGIRSRLLRGANSPY